MRRTKTFFETQLVASMCNGCCCQILANINENKNGRKGVVLLECTQGRLACVKQKLELPTSSMHVPGTFI